MNKPGRPRFIVARWTRALPLLALLGALLSAGAARAQEYVKVENVPREQLPAPQFVAAAYGFIMIAILVYVFVVARRLARTRGDIAELRTQLERATAPGERRCRAHVVLQVPPSSQFIIIPVVQVQGNLIGFLLGARATRDAIATEERRRADRDARRAKRAAGAQSSDAAAPAKAD